MIETLFGADEVPVLGDESDGATINLGTLFRSSVPGDVAGGRWFAPRTRTGVTPHLALYRYDSEQSGTVLAEMDIVDYLLGSWNTFLFPGWVQVEAGALYVLSVWTDRYTATPGKFAADVVSGNLTGPADVAGQRNGRYEYRAAPAYPTNSFGAAGYLVDPLFPARPVERPDDRASSSPRVSAGRSSSPGVAPWSLSSPAVVAGRSSTPGVS